MILATFKLVMQTDPRAWGIMAAILRLTRIGLPGDANDKP